MTSASTGYPGIPGVPQPQGLGEGGQCYLWIADMEAWVCSPPEAWELSVFLAGTGWDLNNFCGIDLSSMS